MRLWRTIGWLGLVAVLQLVTRAVVYALAPGPVARARALGAALGGPRLAVVAIVAIGLAVALAAGIVWLASLGVRERWQLADERPAGPCPRISGRRLASRAAALTGAGWLAFAAVESYLHVRAGLGFHGLACLAGPVHANALPVVAALAVLAAAMIGAVELLVAWMRRTVARFGRTRPPAADVIVAALAGAGRLASAPRPGALPARGPPVVVA